jgi:dihydroxyacetone kinase-like protein
VDIALARAWIAAVARLVRERSAELTELDSAIGDGDHGANLRRGFDAVTVALDGYAAETVGDVLVKTGSTLVSKVGGAAGPLYGTAFRAMGKSLPERADVGVTELAGALRAGLDGVRKLGKAEPGDKTLVDAFGPAVDAYETATEHTGAAASGAAEPAAAGGAAAVEHNAAAEAVAARAAATAAGEGARATTAMQARKGRASYLGPRSVGHQDPGATSTWLIFNALADVYQPAPESATTRPDISG